MFTKRRVMIVDDHPLFRDGLKGLVARSADYQTVGEAGSGDEALRQLDKCRPDLVTMDISLPDMSGIEVVRELRRRTPGIRVLMLSMYPRYEYISDAFKAGASGYVVKEATSTRLIQAMDALSRGEFFLDGQVSQELLARLLDQREGKGGAGDERYRLLSPREQQVLRLVVEGNSTRQIAARFDLTAKTVENHRTNLMKKLGVHDRLELVRYAARLGLIDLNQWRRPDN